MPAIEPQAFFGYEPRMLRKLRLRVSCRPAVRLYCWARGIIIRGATVHLAALPWMADWLATSPLWLELAGFSGQLPALFLSRIAGALLGVAVARWPL
jgi:hypothetical protein